jgi:hypothetical protein
MAANNKQIAGDHYKKYGDLQPWDVVVKWNLGYLEGTALKYIARWRDKGGIDDIKKAIHFLEKLVEISTPVSHTSAAPMGGVLKSQSEQLKPMDLHLNERFHGVVEPFEYLRNSNYPGGPEALDEYMKRVVASKALQEWYDAQ